MRFLYTGATSALASQIDPELSLGGYASSSMLPMNSPQNLFDDLTWKAILDRNMETKAIIIENESGSVVTNFAIGYEYPMYSNYKIEIALVSLVDNTTMEKITTKLDTPYYVSFTEANIDVGEDIDNSVIIPSIAAGERLGMWIRRIATGDVVNQVTCDNVITSQSSQSALDNLQEEIDNIKPITLNVTGNFMYIIPNGKMLEWILFNTAIYPFELNVGTTSGGNEIVTVTVQDAQPIQLLRFAANGSQIIYFSGIPNPTTVKLKIV